MLTRRTLHLVSLLLTITTPVSSPCSLRFYIKCVTCSNEITFKTDPEHADYELEFGATRNFESWRDKEAAETKAAELRAAEDKGDAMKVNFM